MNGKDCQYGAKCVEGIAHFYKGYYYLLNRVGHFHVLFSATDALQIFSLWGSDVQKSQNKVKLNAQNKSLVFNFYKIIFFLTFQKKMTIKLI